MSSGKRIRFSRLLPSSPFGGKGGNNCSSLPACVDFGGAGGSVLLGVGDVNAKTLAAEIGSASMLNSPTGVMFPGTDTAPPITKTDLARRNACGDWEAAIAKFVKGPMAMISIVSNGLSSSIPRISRCEGRLEALKSEVAESGSALAALIALDVSSASGGGRANKFFQVSSGLV